MLTKLKHQGSFKSLSPSLQKFQKRAIQTCQLAIIPSESQPAFLKSNRLYLPTKQLELHP